MARVHEPGVSFAVRRWTLYRQLRFSPGRVQMTRLRCARIRAPWYHRDDRYITTKLRVVSNVSILTKLIHSLNDLLLAEHRLQKPLFGLLTNFQTIQLLYVLI